jgi:hypothetical protein
MENFEIDNFFYVILLVIVVISSFLGKFKKAKTPQNQPKDSVPQNWEDILGELFGAEKPQPKPVVLQTAKPESQKTVKQETGKRKSVYQPKTADRMTAANEGVRTVKDVETGVMDMEEDTGGFSLDDVPDSAEEWRKMIVYNEIFNRKYS